MPGKTMLAALILNLVIASLSAAEQPYPSTYKPQNSVPTLIRNAVILTGTGEKLENADLLMIDGKIQAIGSDLEAGDAVIIDAEGRWLTPGLIDVHSHLGVYPSPSLAGLSDGNEAVEPVTADSWAEHAVWPHDPGFSRALAGGITAMQILPGSANLIGGRSVVLKNVYANTYQDMKFPNAPHGMKMACGENPKRVYGTGRQQAPMTRMGNLSGYRSAWIKADEYRKKWARHEEKVAAGEKIESWPERDLELDTLAAVLDGEILVHMHCYRGDEMATILDMAREFGYKVAAFHHGVEAYKVADRLAAEGVCAALWADWWGFKAEAYDGIQENIALVDRPEGSCAIVHSDSSEGIQRLNQEAAKAMTRGQRAGLDIQPERAIRWLTINAAKSIGIDKQTGSLEPGKMADVVLWNQNPFSVYALADQVFIDGALVFDRSDSSKQPVSDFELGQVGAGGAK